MGKLKIAARYATIPVEILNRTDLSLKAKGLYAFIQSKPDDWAFSSERISNQTKEGRDSIRAALRELESARLLRRSPVVDEVSKRIIEYDYILYDRPYEEGSDDVEPVNGFSVDGEDGPISNIDNSKIDVVNTPYTPKGEGDDDESELPDLHQRSRGVMAAQDSNLPIPKMMAMWAETHPGYMIFPKNDYPAARKIYILLAKKEPNVSTQEEIELIWGHFLAAVASHPFYKDKPLRTVFNHIQDVMPFYFEIKASGRKDIVRIDKDSSGKVTIITKNGPITTIDQAPNKEVKIRLKGWM